MAANSTQYLKEMIRDFDTAMLVTHAHSGELRARPMAIAEVAKDGDIWFVTDRHSPKINDIEADAHVSVCMQNGGKFVSLSGLAKAVDDPRKVEDVWSEHMKVWFPAGKDDPNLLLVCVDPQEGEFWDNSGLNAIKYMIKAGIAYLRGERPENDQTEHGKARL